MFRSIRWRIALPYVVLILVAMIGLALYLTALTENTHKADLRDRLEAEATLLAAQLSAPDSWQWSRERLDALVAQFAASLGARVTVIARDGVVLSDSHENPARMENHLFRPEVQRALAVGVGSNIRYSETLGYDMLYVATVARTGEQVTRVVRLALPLHEIATDIAALRRAALGATLLAAVLGVLLAVAIAERTAQPVRQLTAAAQRVAAGQLDTRLLITSQDEVGALTHAFNEMAAKLGEQMATLTNERARLASVLTHMADGVLITDPEGRVLLVNPAVSRLFEIRVEDALGRSFAQVVRYHQIIEIWRRCHDTGEEQVEAVEVGRQRLFLQVIITPLQGVEAEGYLVILQNLTQVRRLETVRRDFISNISHELRTPLASLKALVDTLRDGALEDPPAAQRFLGRVEVEVDAMTQLVQELLELSRIESGQSPLHLRPLDVAEAIVPPVERLRPQAERAGLRLEVQLPSEEVRVLADRERLQQTMTNLVHNAIKFTPPGGEITVTVQRAGDEVVIAVRDTGVGISADDLPRIFERFYKADRARVGGGTGLGLAIAKHIVQSHGGRIWAESIEGQGSTFYVSLLPAPS